MCTKQDFFRTYPRKGANTWPWDKWWLKPLHAQWWVESFYVHWLLSFARMALPIRKRIWLECMFSGKFWLDLTNSLYSSLRPILLGAIRYVFITFSCMYSYFQSITFFHIGSLTTEISDKTKLGLILHKIRITSKIPEPKTVSLCSASPQFIPDLTVDVPYQSSRQYLALILPWRPVCSISYHFACIHQFSPCHNKEHCLLNFFSIFHDVFLLCGSDVILLCL